MKLVALAAIIAVCGAAKLDRTYLPPPSAATAGGSSDSLQTPLTRTSEQGDSSVLPTGSYTNSFQGVVVDAAGAGTRASPYVDQSGLGGPRDSYGSHNSKVGDAAFRGSLAGFRNTPFNSGFSGQASGIDAGQSFGTFESKSERPQAAKDRNSNIISYANDVSVDNYSYGFETDNGIAIGENGVANNGIQAQGGYSYKGDDGQVYKVTYVADEGGYRPQGDHLPTPPPIPKEILESLERNAKDEAAGLIDDGSYDAQKYNAEGDYTHHNGGNIQHNGAQLSQFAKRPESDATASNTFINQNSQAFGKPGQSGSPGTQNSQSNQYSSNFANNYNGLAGSQQDSNQAGNIQQENLSSSNQGFHQNDQHSGNQLMQQGQNEGIIGSQGQQPAFVSQVETQTQLTSQSGQQLSELQYGQPGQSVQSPQFGSQQQPGSVPQNNNQDNQGSASSFGTNPNRPSFGSFSTANSQPNYFAAQSSQSQGYFGAAEYLPPFNTNKKPSHNKPQVNEDPNYNHSNQDTISSNFVPMKGQNQGASAPLPNSVGSTVFQPQTSQNQQNQPPRPNQSNINNGQYANISPLTPQYSGSDTASSIAIAIKPTSIPSAELTTPLEPNESPVFTQNSQFNVPSSSNFGNFGSQSLNIQALGQASFQNSNAATQQPVGQTISSSFDSRPQGISQFGSTSPAPAAFSTTQKPDKKESVYSQNSASQFQQSSFSQGSDNSYYYNQPSKPFGTSLADRPQGSRFPIQPNNVISSQNNQYFNQQGLQQNYNKFPKAPQVAPAAPTPSSQSSQIQGSFTTNPYNGITQASISPFPSVSPTTSTQYGQANRFGSKPNVLPFSSRPGTTIGQNLAASFTQNQIPLEQSISFNNSFSSASQSISTKPTTDFGQTSTPTQLATNENDQAQSPEANKEQLFTATQTQQYDGTVYEYNKPPEVLPASEQNEQSDSSSSQSIQTDSSTKPQKTEKSKVREPQPQFGSHQTQFTQGSLQSQQSNFNQETKPQFGSQALKPFGGSQAGQNPIGQNIGSTINQQNKQGLQDSAQSTKPNKSIYFTSNQFGQNQQAGFGSNAQIADQLVKPYGSSFSSSQLGYNSQQQTSQFGVQSLKPFGGAQATQYGQSLQSSFGGSQQNSALQFSAQPNKPIGSGFGSSPFGEVTQNQGSFNNNFPSKLQYGQQSFSTTGSTQNNESAKPFGNGVSQSFQGYPSTKPQSGNQLTLPQFTQTSQQSFEGTHINSQPQVDTDQNTQVSHGSTQPGLLGQQFVQNAQSGSPALKPQHGTQAQLVHTQKAPSKPFGSATSQAQFGSGSAQASSSVVSQPSSIQTYKPFAFSSNFPSQSKPQFDQAPLSSTVSTTSAPQIAGQFGLGIQGAQSQTQVSQSSAPCCRGIDKDSAIAPLNVGKPSQAFAQTQSQFSGFQGAQSFNAQSLAGKGEEFGGPRQPPSFDAQTGYHY